MVVLHPGHHRLQVIEQVGHGLVQLKLHKAGNLPDTVRLLRHLLGQLADGHLHLPELGVHLLLEVVVHRLGPEVVVLRLKPEVVEVVALRLEPKVVVLELPVLVELGVLELPVLAELGVLGLPVLAELGVPGLLSPLERWV